MGINNTYKAMWAHLHQNCNSVAVGNWSSLNFLVQHNTPCSFIYLFIATAIECKTRVVNHIFVSTDQNLWLPHITVTLTTPNPLASTQLYKQVTQLRPAEPVADSKAGILKQEQMQKVSVPSNSDTAWEVLFCPGCANAFCVCVANVNTEFKYRVQKL